MKDNEETQSLLQNEEDGLSITKDHQRLSADLR
jgi:hypothetical protein